MNEITQDELKKLFLYDPVTGHFFRLTKSSKNTKIGEIAGRSEEHTSELQSH